MGLHAGIVPKISNHGLATGPGSLQQPTGNPPDWLGARENYGRFGGRGKLSFRGCCTPPLRSGRNRRSAFGRLIGLSFPSSNSVSFIPVFTIPTITQLRPT